MSTPYDAEWLEYDDDTRPTMCSRCREVPAAEDSHGMCRLCALKDQRPALEEDDQ